MPENQQDPRLLKIVNEAVICDKIHSVSDFSLVHYKQKLIEVNAKLKLLNRLYRLDLKNMRMSQVLERQVLKQNKKQIENAICFMEIKEKQDRGEKVLGGMVRLV